MTHQTEHGPAGPEPDGTLRRSSEEGTGDFVNQPALGPEIQPSRAGLTRFVPKPELFLEPGLPHHGQLHGEETMIWSAVILHQAYQDVLERKGEEAAMAFVANVDPEVLFFAAAYHDCGRQSDWGYHNGEMRKHGPRGAKLFDQKSDVAADTLSGSQKEAVVSLIHSHTRTASDARAIRGGKLDDGKNYEDYVDPQVLMLRLLQDADALGLTRTWYSMEFNNSLLRIIATRVRAHRVKHAGNITKPGYVGKSLHFPRTAELIPAAHRLAWTDRHDPDIIRLFPNDKTGAAMESAERLGILST